MYEDYDDEVNDEEYVHYEEDYEDEEEDEENKKKENDFETLDDDNDLVDIVVKTDYKKTFYRGKDRQFNRILFTYEHDRLVGTLLSMIDTKGFNVDPMVFDYCKRDGYSDRDITKSLTLAKVWTKYCKVIPYPLELRRHLRNDIFEIWHPMECILPHELEEKPLFMHEIDEIDRQTWENYNKRLYSA